MKWKKAKIILKIEQKKEEILERLIISDIFLGSLFMFSISLHIDGASNLLAVPSIE